METEAEESVLSQVLGSSRSFWEAREIISSDDFSTPNGKELFEAIEAANGLKDDPDALFIANVLRSRGTLTAFGGEMELLAMALKWPGGNVRDHAEIVRQLASRRRFKALGAEVLRRAESATEDELDALLIEAIMRRAKRTTFSTMDVAVDRAADAINAKAKSSGDDAPPGILFGVPQLDWVLGGLQPGEQCVVAADVGGGKTALAMQAVLNLVMGGGGAALVFSLEMTEDQLAERCLCHVGEVNSRLVRTGRMKGPEDKYYSYLSPSNLQSIEDARRKLKGLPLHLETQAFDIRRISARANAWRARNRSVRGLIVVDFLQLIIAETQKGETRARAVGQAAYALKALAKTLNVSMITLSQLARSASKTGEPPTMHDLKESGDIEASADSIVLVYNKDKVSDGEVALIVAKNRQGECRAARAYWRARHYAFTKVAMEEQRWNG